jgi:hypothetical protein
MVRTNPFRHCRPLITFQTLGYQRTLQASDLWKLDEARTSASLVNRFESAFKRRVEAAEQWNKGILDGTIHPSVFRRTSWFFRSRGSSQRYEELEDNWRRESGRESASIALALNEVLGTFFWVGGVYKVVADTAQLVCPLLVRVRLGRREFGKYLLMFWAANHLLRTRTGSCKEGWAPKAKRRQGYCLGYRPFLADYLF